MQMNQWIESCNWSGGESDAIVIVGKRDAIKHEGRVTQMKQLTD